MLVGRRGNGSENFHPLTPAFKGIEMCRELLENGVEGVHFYTLNLERSVTQILGINNTLLHPPMDFLFAPSLSCYSNLLVPLTPSPLLLCLTQNTTNFVLLTTFPILEHHYSTFFAEGLLFVTSRKNHTMPWKQV